MWFVLLHVHERVYFLSAYNMALVAVAKSRNEAIPSRCAQHSICMHREVQVQKKCPDCCFLVFFLVVLERTKCANPPCMLSIIVLLVFWTAEFPVLIA